MVTIKIKSLKEKYINNANILDCIENETVGLLIGNPNFKAHSKLQMR